MKPQQPISTFPIAGYFCINLPDRQDRYQVFATQMAETKPSWIAPIEEHVSPGVRYRSFSDIHSPIPPLAAYLKARPEGTQLGTIGCYHAHMRALEKIAALDTHKWYVVFEDDIRILSHKWLTIMGALRLPKGCENTNIVFVDPLGTPLPADQIEASWYRISRTHPHYYGAHCYIVLGSRAAQNVLNTLKHHPVMEDVDGVIAMHGHSLAWYPKLVNTRFLGSDRLG